MYFHVCTQCHEASCDSYQLCTVCSFTLTPPGLKEE